jgi:hypothetical protein
MDSLDKFLLLVTGLILLLPGLCSVFFFFIALDFDLTLWFILAVPSFLISGYGIRRLVLAARQPSDNPPNKRSASARFS